nr:matrix protein [Walnut Creek virus]
MLSIWKKKKTVRKDNVSDDGDSIMSTGSPLWLASAPPPYLSTIPYSGVALYGDEDDNVSLAEAPMHHDVTLDISGSIEIITQLDINNPNLVLALLEELLDTYRGSLIYKPIFLSMGLLLGMHMTRKRRGSGIYAYTGDIFYPISFRLSSKIPQPERKIEFKTHIKFRRGKHDIALSLDVARPTNKEKGMKLQDVYNQNMPNGESPPSFSYGLNYLQVPNVVEDEQIVLL